MKGKVIYTMAHVKIAEVRPNIFLKDIKATILSVLIVRSTTLSPHINRTGQK